jgi:hypothetical protein
LIEKVFFAPQQFSDSSHRTAQPIALWLDGQDVNKVIHRMRPGLCKCLKIKALTPLQYP